jgi:hypothetical protein
MHNPELHSLAAVNWQYFCTLTFRGEKQCKRFGPQMFVALLRTQAKVWKVHFKRVLWCLRRESGESTGRWHLHAVIAGLPPSAGPRNCLALMSQWETLGGGMARVSRYDSSLDGLDYILKGSGLTESKATRWAGDYHELAKFGQSCDVTLSESVVRYLGNRQQPGQRGTGSRKTGGIDTASSTVQGGVSNTPPVIQSLLRR